MKLLLNKSVWKLVLFFSALFIFIGSVWYTNHVVKRFADEEKEQVILWAQAIQEKAKLLKYTNELFEKITLEEKKKAELWAKAIKEIEKETDPNQDIGFIFEVIKNNETIPVILTDENDQILSVKNIENSITEDPVLLATELKEMKAINPPIRVKVAGKTANLLYFKDSKIFTASKNLINNTLSAFISEDVIRAANLPVIYVAADKKEVLAHNLHDKIGQAAIPEQELEKLKLEVEPIRVEIADGIYNYIYYRESTLLTQLRIFPVVQFVIIGVFLFIAYLVFSTERKAEQNQVWVGMSKETAHQLGTPISSLMAWMELFKSKYAHDEILGEMGRDVERLEMITERFSKIGSVPSLESNDIVQELQRSVDYLKNRLSSKVSFSIESINPSVFVEINKPLLSWVIENLSKNAVDAMSGKGSITYNVSENDNEVIVDITDTGKGIPKSKYKNVFQPGFTTKSRGWGLGLTLVKRIIEEYHKGKIFVKSSELGKGTTFRIILNK